MRDILRKWGVDDIAMIGVAKGVDRDAGKEEFYRTGKPVMALRHNDPVLYFVQRLRDEAHRFAITGHRGRRDKARQRSALQDIPGVGAKRRRELLRHFGSAQGVQNANIDELKKISGISAAIAQQIYDHLHNG